MSCGLGIWKQPPCVALAQGFSWSCSQMKARAAVSKRLAWDPTPISKLVHLHGWQAGGAVGGRPQFLLRSDWVSSDMAVGFPRLRDSRDQDRSCNAFYNLALKVTHCYFCPLRPAKFSMEGDIKGVNIRRCGSLGSPHCLEVGCHFWEPGLRKDGRCYKCFRHEDVHHSIVYNSKNL